MKTDNCYPWINPVGGLGDTLMVSGVLKLLVDRYPERRFNLVRRVSYPTILKGHPAIAAIGHPPKDAPLLGTDYWSRETLGPGEQRAFQILCRMFGLPTPAEERLYFPGTLENDAVFHQAIPYGRINIVIAPSSSSPRKEMHPANWHNLVDMLLEDGHFVAQVGKMNENHIRNAYFLLGLTTPPQLISLLSRFDVVVTSDNFVMHAAHLVGKPAVVLWGPTDHRVYGYPEQIHLQAEKSCPPDYTCIGPQSGHLYDTPCPFKETHCMDSILPEAIHEAVNRQLAKRS